MRFVQSLDPLTEKLLGRLYKHSKKHLVRQRAHGILLSAAGTPVLELAALLGKTPRTIYNWLDRWEERRFAGLYDAPGRGRKKSLNASREEQVRHWIKEHPKNPGKVIALVKEHTGVLVSKRTIQRILHTLRFRWRRVRRKPRGKPDPEKYAQRKQQLEVLKAQEAAGEIALYYFDESGFCQIPYLPYAWQEKGETLALESERGKRLNVLGFLSRVQGLTAYTREGSVTTELVIACFDAFANTLTQKTVVVLDNASFHTSAAIEKKISEWKSKNLELFYLPERLVLVETLCA